MGHGRIDETMIYVYVASAHQRPLPDELRVTLGNADPDRRILALLGQRATLKWAEPDRRCIPVVSQGDPSEARNKKGPNLHEIGA
jgi:hypothetical protein